MPRPLILVSSAIDRAPSLEYSPSMKTNRSLILAVFIATSMLLPRAADGNEKTGLGIGAETFLTTPLATFGVTPGVATLTYDTSVWRVSGLLAMLTQEDSVTILGFGGRFYYPIHRRHDSDFSIGGGLAILNTNPDPGDSDTSFHIEGGAQLRAFLTDNVALSSTVGLAIVVADDDGPAPDDSSFGILGQLVGSFGVTYFFW